jgi:Astacin (Peptidase family M12A)
MSKRAKAGDTRGKVNAAPVVSPRYCAVKFPKVRAFAPGVAPERARLIRQTADKWLNGTTIRYWFFDTPKKWTAPESQKKVVREAFGKWKALAIGLDFAEVGNRADADVRIAFDQTDGSWSYIGTDVRTKRRDPRTMNFGWSLTADPDEGMDTAIHEIGHTLGFPHEHQNPFAGIVWNEPAVYASLAAPPNRWSRATTYHNIIEKIVPDTVQGSKWDPDSVMHYPFEAGLIDKPIKYRKGLTPAGGLSARDRLWAHKFYPGLRAEAQRPLEPLQSKALALQPGQQANFSFLPERSREYEFRTFGPSDTVMALYEKRASGLVEIDQDDDSGAERNAHIKATLKAGRAYVLRVRLHYAKAKGQTAVMVW